MVQSVATLLTESSRSDYSMKDIVLEIPGTESIDANDQEYSEALYNDL